MYRLILNVVVFFTLLSGVSKADFVWYTVSGHNGQFTQLALTNGPLGPLVNSKFYGHATYVWLTDSNGKGSYHTFDWSQVNGMDPQEFIVMPWGPPNTTTNTQQFMYFRRFGTAWYASSIITLPWVTATFP